MNSKTIKILIAIKAVLLTGAGFYFYKHPPKNLFGLKPTVAESSTQTEASGTSKKYNTQDGAAPGIPEKILSTSEANAIRTQLEFLKNQIEVKTESLAQAKKSYDKSKEDIDIKLKKIEEERTLLQESIQQEKKAKAERVTESIEFFAKMEPRKSAPIIAAMDRDLVIALLRKLPPRLVTKILEAMPAQKASEFLEYYTKIKSGREYALMKELGLCKPDDEPGMFSTESTPAPTPAPATIATPETAAAPTVAPSATPTAAP